MKVNDQVRVGSQGEGGEGRVGSRVCSANIIWISPDSSTWGKNYSRTDRGELALEIVLEKIHLKHHGDAWRLAMDACPIGRHPR